MRMIIDYIGFCEAHIRYFDENMMFTIQKAKIPQCGYEITAKGFHKITPSIEETIKYLQGRFGYDVKYKIKPEEE